MKKFATLFSVMIIVLLTLNVDPVAAKAKKKGFHGTLKDIETLFFITQDLEESTPVFIDSTKSCFCACRDNSWSCTELSCKMHLKDCSEAAAQASGLAQSQNQPSYFDPVYVPQTVPQQAYQQPNSPQQNYPNYSR